MAAGGGLPLPVFSLAQAHPAQHNKTAPRGHGILDVMDAIVSAARLEPTSGSTRCPAGVRLFTAALLLLAAALSGCAWLDAKEVQFALRPTAGRPPGLPPDEKLFKPGDERWLVEVPAASGAGTQRLALWWLPQPDPAAPALLYLHGTFRNLYQNLSKIDALRDAGYAVLAVDYRGWGDSTVITPSEASIAADAATAWAELQRRQPDAGRRVIFGHSMGGAVAVRLASGLKGGTDYHALVLESTFTRMPDVAAEAGFWGRVAASITSLEFDSLSRIPRIDAPILMLHGTADTTVPIVLGRRLRDAAPASTRFIEIPGGTHSRLHSEAPERYREALQSVMKEPMNTDTRKRIPAPPSRATSP